MTDSDRCRGTAARYARLSELTNSAEIRRSYKELERLWLEMAGNAEQLAFENQDSLRHRIYRLVDDAKLVMPRVNH